MSSGASLAGLRVIEIGLFHAGPAATAMLAALGAEVIKVEDVKSGDPVRNGNRVYGQDSSLVPGRSVPFETYNGGKRSIGLDIASERGRALLYGLVAKADVFLHNMRVATATKLKIDFASLREQNPRLVYANVSGFGPTGPDAARPGLDPVGLARSGLMTAVSGGSHRMPILPPMGMADRMAGILTAYGIMAALFARDRTGTAQQVESSLLGGAMWLGHMNIQHALFKGTELLPPAHESDALFNTYRCADGRYIFIAAMQPAAWPALCRGTGMPELATDPRFADAPGRQENRAALIGMFEERFAARDSAAWDEDFRRETDLVFEIVRHAADVGGDAQILANDYVIPVQHPELGLVQKMTLPLHVNGEVAAGAAGPSPRHGEHGDGVLRELLGMAESEIVALRTAGVLK